MVELVYLIFIMLNDNFGHEPEIFKMWSLFLTETRCHASKCNIEEQWVYWSLPVLLDHFWRNVISIYRWSLNISLFLFSIKFVSLANSFTICWLKLFISLFSCFFIDTELSPQSAKTQNTLQLVCLVGR